MAGFNFDEVEQYVQESSSGERLTFLKLQDDGYYANLRFMYGPNETFQAQTVHNVSSDPRKPKWVPCLRGLKDPLEACPLCANGYKFAVQFFIPVYVHSIVSMIRGVPQEEQVNQVMILQKGTMFRGALQSVMRYTQPTNKPIVSSVFRLVRNGRADDQKTTYLVEYVSTDDVTLENLPERPQILGSYILPNLDYNTMMEKYINNKSTPSNVASAIQPRTVNMNTFAGNSVVNSPNMTNVSSTPLVTPSQFQPINTNQAPVQVPNIGSNGAPF